MISINYLLISDKNLSIVVSKLNEMQVESLSDSDIELAFSETCLPTKLTALAKKARDLNLIEVSQ